jgi:VanZ family protein
VIGGILAFIVAGIIFYLSSLQNSSYPSHPSYFSVVAHICEYALLALLLTVAFNSPKRKLWQVALLAIIVASLYGISDELHQYFVPTRHCDPFDWLADTLGAFLGSATMVWIISARQVKKSRSRDTLL